MYRIAANLPPPLPSPLPDPTLVVALLVSVVAAEVPLGAGIAPKAHRPAASPAAVLGVDARVAGQYWATRR